MGSAQGATDYRMPWSEPSSQQNPESQHGDDSTSNPPTHAVRLGGDEQRIEGDPDPERLVKLIEPWLAALLQSERVSLLVGNGLTLAVAQAAEISAPNMDQNPFTGAFADKIEQHARETAADVGRQQPNIEDRIRSALALLEGLRVLRDAKAQTLHNEIDAALGALARQVLAAERELVSAIASREPSAERARALLTSFLLTFANRPGPRERLNFFTTNYDRYVEWAADYAGLHLVDRFVGGLEPVFRASRLSIDLHYNPPGIRGEPRYLEGVVRFGKIHGSLDWRYRAGVLRRIALPFGADDDHPAVPSGPGDALMIFPNPAKDVETLLFPYAELFRDFAAAICYPNSVLITYGYGYGDDHINRIIGDMLSIPSTHLVVISYDWCSGRLDQFLRSVRSENTTLLVGPHFADLETLVAHYLPKPAIDVLKVREADLLSRRQQAARVVNDGDGSGGGDREFSD